LQKSRFLLQLCTPCNQDLVRSLFIVIAFINDLLDGHFPFMKTHRLFLFDFGVGGDVGVCLPAGRSQPKNEEAERQRQMIRYECPVFC
jgi:hypothetical protein